MSNYALGPWTTNELDWRVVQDAGGFVVADVRVPAADDGRLVATRISAAPELYGICREILPFVIQMENFYNSVRPFLRTIHDEPLSGEALTRLLRATPMDFSARLSVAIAKAEGRA